MGLFSRWTRRRQEPARWDGRIPDGHTVPQGGYRPPVHVSILGDPTGADRDDYLPDGREWK